MAERTVNIAINVTGVNTEQLRKLAEGFTEIGTAVQNSLGLFNSLKDTLNSFKVPAELNTLISGIKELGNVKVPNIKQLAQGFERLSKIEIPPDLGKFAEEAKKFNNVKVPNIKQLAQGLEQLTASTLDMQNAGARLRIVHRNLKRFSEIKVPNITNIAKGLEELIKVADTNIQTTSLNTLAEALQKLSGLKAPKLTPFVDSLKKLAFLNIDDPSKKLGQLASVLNQFGDRQRIPNISGLVNGLERLVNVKVNEVVVKIRELNGALKELDRGGYLKSFAGFANNLNKISTSLDKTKKAFDKYGVAVQGAGKHTKTFIERAKNYFQYRFIADALFLIKGAIVEAFNAIKDYDQALKDLQAITGATGLEVKQMGATIKEVASGTKFSAQEVAEGMRTLGQAGFSASEAVQTMQAVSDLATGTLSDMSTTVDLVTTAMRVFQIDASKSGMVADTFANAVNKSKLTIDKLKIAMNYVGPIAEEAGVAFQEMSASMMTLANVGLRPSTIGTGLRRVLAELVDPSEKLIAAARRAGIAFSDLDPQTRDFSKVIDNLGLVVNDTQTAFDIFGKRGAAAVLALVNSEGQFDQMLATVSKSGTAAKMASIQMKGLGVSFKNLQDKLGLLAIALGDTGITDALRVIINISRNVVDALTAIVNTGFVKVIAKSAVLVGSVWAIHAVFKGLIVLKTPALFISIAGAVTKLGSALAFAEVQTGLLAMAFNPLLLVLGGIAVAAALAFASFGGAKKAAEEAAMLADEYSTLSKTVSNYEKDTVNMKSGSDELLEANKDLRIKLLEVASGMSAVSDEADKAALSINPLTGIITKGSTAIAEYNDEVERLNFNALIKSASEAERNVEQVSGQFNRFLNRSKTGYKVWVDDFKTFTKLTTALVTGEFEKGNNIAEQYTRKTIKLKTKMADAADFSKALNEGKIDFQEFSDFINSLDMFNLTAQEEDLVEAFKLLDTESKSLTDNLVNMAEVDLNDTVENMVKFAEKSKITGNTLNAVETRLIKLKKINTESTKSIIEKWGEDAKETKQDIIDYTAIYKKLGGEITDVQLIQMQSSQKNKEVLVELSNMSKEVRDTEIKNKKDIGQAYDAHLDYTDALAKKSSAIQREDSENTAAQKIFDLANLTKAHEKNIARINKTYEGKIGLLKTYLRKAENEFKETRSKLVKGVLDPEKLVADTKVVVKGVQSSYATMYRKIELASLKVGANRKALSAERLRLEKEEAGKIEKIQITLSEKINKATGPDSPSARAAEIASLNAQIASGKITVGHAQKIAKETAEAQERVYENANVQRETTHALLLSRISSAEANGVISHEKAEQLKLQASLDYYDQAWQKAKEYLAQAQGTEEHQKRLKSLLDLEKKYYSEKEKYVDNYSKKVDSLNKNLEKKDEDRQKKVKSHNQKIAKIDETFRHKREEIHNEYLGKIEDADTDYEKTKKDIEKDLSDAIKDIKKDLVNELGDIQDERVQDAKDLKVKLLEIEESTADKIRKINQRGMNDVQKDQDNVRIAYQKLAKAKKMQREAEKTGNAELAKQAQTVLSDVQNLATEFDNVTKARKLVNEAGESLKSNAVIQKNIKDLKLEKEAVEAIADAEGKKRKAREGASYDKQKADTEHQKDLDNIGDWKETKNKAAQYVSEQAIGAEDQRHTNEMTNLAAEISKMQEKLQLAEKIAKAAASDVLGDAKEQSTETVLQKKTPDAEDNVLVKSLKASKQAIQEMGNQYASTASDIKQHQNEIAENGYRVIEVNGKKMFTNLTNDQRSAMALFGDAAESASKSMDGIGDSGKAEFQKIYDAHGKLVEITAEDLSIKFSEPQNVPNLEEYIPQNMDVELRVNHTMGRVQAHIDSLQNKLKRVGETGTGLKIMGPEQIAQVDAIADKVGGLFDGLSTEDPKQKIQDMITVMQGMGPMSNSLFADMSQSISNYAESVDGVGVSLKTSWKTGEIQVLKTSAAVDESGQKIEGLSDKLQSNPLKLFDDSANEDIVKNIENIEGAMEHLQERVQEEIQLQVDSENVQSAMTEALDSFYTAEEEIASTPIIPKIELDKDGAQVVKEAFEETKKVVEDDLVEVSVEADTTEIDSQVDDKITDLEDKEVNISIVTENEKLITLNEELVSLTEEEKEVSLVTIVDNAEFEAFAEELAKIIEQSPIDIQIQVQVQNTNDMSILLEWLEQLDEHNPKKVNVATEVTGHKEVTALKQAIDKLINKIVRILADVTGINKVRELRNEINKLENKIVWVTADVTGINKVKALRNEISKLGNKIVERSSSEKKASGGEVQGFNTGGSIFKKLASPFISRGSGTKDDVPAMLTKGEFVQKVAAVRKYGKRFMEMVNAGLYPVELARRTVPNFAQGGAVVDNSFARLYANGGQVMSGLVGGLRKKIFELLGKEITSEINFDINNINLNPNIDQQATDITSDTGQEFLSSMSTTFNESVAQLASGGSITQINSKFEDQKRSITSSYDALILEARAAGKEEIAILLTAEKDALATIADTLKTDLNNFKIQYNEEMVARRNLYIEEDSEAKTAHDEDTSTRKESHNETLADLKETYDEDMGDENQSYNRDVEDDTIDYTADKKDYEDDLTEQKTDYEKTIVDLEETYATKAATEYSKAVDYMGTVRKNAKTINDIANTFDGLMFDRQQRSYHGPYTYIYKDTPVRRNNYLPDAEEVPDISKAYQIIDRQTGEGGYGKTPKSLADGYKEGFEEAIATYQEAVSSLKDMGIKSNLINDAHLDDFRNIKKVTDHLIKIKENKDKNSALSEYADEKNTTEEDWNLEKIAWVLNNTRRDDDHVANLTDYKKDYNESLTAENESYTEDNTTYKETYKEALKTNKENYNADIVSYKEEYDASVVSAREKAAEDVLNAKQETKEGLGSIKKETTETVKDVSTKYREQLLLQKTNILDARRDIKETPNLDEWMKRIFQGRQFGFNVGGEVPHTSFSLPGKDSIMAALTPGEFVIKEGVVSHFGAGFFKALNNFKIPKFNDGGVIGTIANDFQDNIMLSEVKHALELTVNGDTQEPLYGSKVGIDDIINSLEMAKLRS